MKHLDVKDSHQGAVHSKKKHQQVQDENVNFCCCCLQNKLS